MIGKVYAQRYALQELIGKGGMAMVYRAKDLRTGHSVAIKILRQEYSQDEEFLGRFQREAQAASKMSHHNIVNLLDVGMEGDDRYLVMEYVQGKTLKEVIKEKGQMTPKVAVQIAIRILAALQHAHKNGIIHRDIKPQNILVHADGHIKVADFGIARMADSSTLTKGDNVMGSVHYFSPEQASGRAATEQSDLYSVGVVLYEMLTGKVPFDGDTPVSVAMQHLRSQPVPIKTLNPEVPDSLCRLVETAMQKEPKYRYQTALEMARDLRVSLDDRAELTGAPQRPNLKSVVEKAVPPPRSGKVSGKTGARRPVKTRRQLAVQAAKWLSMILLCAAVFYGLYLGGSAIYQRVMNTTSAPDLVGMDKAAAVLKAERAGLKTELVEVNHASIAAGLIIMQTPEFETSMHKNDTIVLTVSKGPVALKTPSVLGMTSQAAVEILKNQGLILTITEKVVSTEPIDTILSQKPEAEMICYAGDTLQVVVSGGSAIVPDVMNQDQASAEKLITDAGLMAGADYVPTQDESLHGRAMQQQPASGAQVIQGAAVTVTYYQYTPVYHGQATLELPRRDGGVHVRVTLMEEDGTEKDIYAAMHTADGSLVNTVEVEDDGPGERTLRIYLDGTLYDETIVDLR